MSASSGFPHRRGLLYRVPALTVLVMLGPVAAGLIGTVLPAIGHYPPAGATGLSSAPFAALFDWPGLGPAVRLSVTTGLAATVISLLIVTLLLAGAAGRPALRFLRAALAPLLSVPHAAAAFGLAFLIAPSGWIARLVSPELTGWDRPPDLLILNDPGGWALVAGLVVKEVPFLLLMSLAALPQTDSARSMEIAGALGHARVGGWLRTVFPRLYAQIRLPVYVVLAYSMSVVDAAIILGPNTPPPLSVQIVRWMSDPDLSMRMVAAAGAIVQLALVVAALSLWAVAERLVAWAGRRWIEGGSRGHGLDTLGLLGEAAGAVSAVLVLGGLAVLGVWSVAGFWGFPDALPGALTFDHWQRHGPGAAEALGQTALIAGVATAAAVALTLGCLEAEHRFGLHPGAGAMWLLYLPLLMPQTAFLPGLQVLMLGSGARMGLGPVILAHVVFVLPYVFLSLSDPWRAWDARQATVAATLGAPPRRVLSAVRLPMMAGPLLTAAAVGLAVSVGQYLPTLLIGGGRVMTLTTEAVALASGGDRRAIGVYGLWQTGAALIPFAVAALLPLWLWRNRRGMRHG